MSNQEMSSRLSRISTRWSLLLEAHHDTDEPAAMSGRRLLLDDYSGAVYRYLLGAVRDPEAAEELSHEFAVRFLRGDFRRARPERGRFRQYVKTVLINLVNDYFKSRNRQPQQFPTDAPGAVVGPHGVESGSEGESLFEECLHDELLDRTWEALKQANAKQHAALLMRVENPDLTSRELAAELEEKLKTSVTSDWVRKTIERARAKFAGLLIDQVAAMLDSPSPDELRQELKDLKLLPYCREALEKRKQTVGT